MTYEQEQKLRALTNRDMFFQELLLICRALEPEYIRIRDSLPEKDRIALEQYITLCEEMEYRRTCLALEL